MKTVKYFIYAALFVLSFASCKKKTIIPIPPTSLTATAVSSSQINLTWTDNSTNETGFKVERKTGTGSYSFVATVSSDISIFNDNGLAQNTIYTYRVYAYNSAGRSLTYSNEASATTSGVPILNTMTVSSITASSALSGGAISSDGSTPIVARGVVWSTNPAPTVSLSTKTTDGTGIGSFASNITGLNANTTYYVRAYATNNTGTGYGNEVIFSTLSIDIITGLVAYYPFSGNANDSIGNNHGTPVGTFLTSDRFGVSNKAYSFNGSSNYVSLSNTFFNGQIVSNLSYSVWVKIDFLPPTNRTYQISGKEGFWRTVSLGINDKGGVIFEWSYPNPQQYSGGVTPNSLLSPNIWYNIIVTMSGTTLKFYLNGTLSYTTTSIGVIDYSYLSGGNSTSTNYIGAVHPVSPGITNFFNGIIDDFRIYDRPLTQEQITYLATH